MSTTGRHWRGSTPNSKLRLCALKAVVPPMVPCSGGLVDEVAFLLHPSLVGGLSSCSFVRVSDLESSNGVIELKLMEKLKDDIPWLMYEVKQTETFVFREQTGKVG